MHTAAAVHLYWTYRNFSSLWVINEYVLADSGLLVQRKVTFTCCIQIGSLNNARDLYIFIDTQLSYHLYKTIRFTHTFNVCKVFGVFLSALVYWCVRNWRKQAVLLYKLICKFLDSVYRVVYRCPIWLKESNCKELKSADIFLTSSIFFPYV